MLMATLVFIEIFVKFQQLDHEQICVNFTVERWYPVANMSRYLPVRVYDYYAPGKLHRPSLFNKITKFKLDLFINHLFFLYHFSFSPYRTI